MLKKLIGVVILLSVLSPFSHAQEAPHHLRFAHLSPQFPEVNVLLDNELLLEGVPFDSFSKRVEIAAGDHEILVADIDNNTVIGPIPLTFEPGGWSTLTLTGTIAGNNLNLRSVSEQINEIPVNVVHLHVFNMADDSVLSVQAGEELLSEIPFNTSVFFAEFSFNAYEKITIYDGEDVVFELTPDAPYKSYLLITTRIEGEIRTLFDEIDLGTRFRMAHFAPDVSSVDVLLNGQIVQQGIAYESLTDVIDIPYGTYEVAVVPSGQDDPLLPPQQVTFLPDEISILILSGQIEAGNLMSQIVIQSDLGDNAALMSGQNAVVEVRHTIEEAPPIDVLLADGTVLIEGLPFGDTVGVLDLPEGTYDFRITVSGEPETVLYEQAGTFLEGGKIHWMTLIGRYNDVTIGRQRLNLVSFCVRPEGCE